MSEEEKKAIETLEAIKDDIFVFIKNHGWIKDMDRIIKNDVAINSIDTILNLIEKSQKENEELQEVQVSANAVNRISILENEKRLYDERIHNLTETILSQNRKINDKDKIIIDLVAKGNLKYESYVRNNYISKDKIINLINWLDADIKNITKVKNENGYIDDYKKCRLKAYRTKTKEIKQRLEELLED